MSIPTQQTPDTYLHIAIDATKIILHLGHQELADTLFSRIEDLMGLS